MAYKEHPDLRLPDNPQAKIWRYMNFTKFVSLIEQRALYFSRLDSFLDKDPYEGLYTKMNAKVYDVNYEDMPEEHWKSRGVYNEETWNVLKNIQNVVNGMSVNQRVVTFANCWNISEVESAAMWPLYIDGQDGVAICTTVERLIKSLNDYNDFEIYMGAVEYLDYNVDIIREGQLLLPLMTKRKSFEHERELRALIWTLQHGKNSIEENSFSEIYGLTVPVDLEILIDQIFVAPTAANWFADLVASVMSQYGLDKTVKKSDLLSDPMY